MKSLNPLGDKMNNNKIEDLQEFFKIFEIRIDGDKTIPRYHPSNYSYYDPETTATMQIESVPAYQLTISIRQLERLVNILNGKGYYHDDMYQIKMHEEELILSNPHLKHLHDQYKTLLYMLNDKAYDQYN